MYKASKASNSEKVRGIHRHGRTILLYLSDFLTTEFYWLGSSVIISIFLLLLLGLNLITSEGTGIEICLTIFLSFTLSIVGALVYGGFIWILDCKNREPFKIFPALFLSGSLAAIVAFFINSGLGITNYIALDNSQVIDAILILAVAPFVEEFLKGTGLFIMSRTKYFYDIFDGFMYGFIIGMGFAFIENIIYLTQYPPMESGILSWAILVFTRILITGFGQGMFTGLNGIVLGVTKGKSPAILNFGAGLSLAVIAHGIYNGTIALTNGLWALEYFVILLLMIFTTITFIEIKNKKNNKLN